MKKQNIINNNGTHKACNSKSIEYGIENGNYWYYCHKCKRVISGNSIINLK